jgi:hypothetical protein
MSINGWGDLAGPRQVLQSQEVSLGEIALDAVQFGDRAFCDAGIAGNNLNDCQRPIDQMAVSRALAMASEESPREQNRAANVLLGLPRPSHSVVAGRAIHYVHLSWREK